MSNTRSKITDTHRQEAASLKALWSQRQSGITQAHFADKYGLGSQGNVGHYLNARNPLNPGAATAFARELGVDVGAFSPRVAAEIRALQTPESSHDTLPAILDRDDDASADSVIIAQYDVAGAMGTGGLVLEGNAGVIRKWVVDPLWLQHNVRSFTSKNNLCIVTGFGPSMQPRFNSGDPLLMDRGVTKVEIDGVFFFRVADSGFIKQLQRLPRSSGGIIIRAKSYNPDYDPFDITPDMDFEVFGKILTIWRSEQM